MKKICFVTQGELPVPARKGGAVETLVEYIVDNNEINHNFEIDVITVDDDSIKDANYNYTRLFKVDRYDGSFAKIWDFIYRVLKKAFGIYIPYSITSRRMLKILKERHDSYDLVIYEAGPTTQIPLIAKYVDKNKLLVHVHWDGCSNRKIDNSFGYLIPVSGYIASVWKNGCDRDDDGIFVLRNCAPVEYFSKHTDDFERQDLRNKLNIPAENKVVIFTGRIVWEKGVLELLSALEKIGDKNVSLLIVGSANFGNATYTRYEKQVQELVLHAKHQVVFTGYVHQKELYKYYDIADIAVMPSQFQDPAPLVSIETQATGTPLIAMRVGGIPEYVTSESAVLVDKNDRQVDNLAKEITSLLSDADKRKTMSEAGVDNAQKYTVQHFYNDFIEITEEIGKRNEQQT